MAEAATATPPPSSSTTPHVTREIRLPKTQLLALGIARSLTQRTAERTQHFHRDLQYLASTGLSRRAIARALDVDHRTVDNWFAGAMPTDKARVWEITGWAADARKLEAALSEQSSVSVSLSSRRLGSLA